MWWLMAIFSGFFLYGITRPRHYTHNTYVENYVDVDCDGGSGGGDSYCDTSDASYSDGGGSDD